MNLFDDIPYKHIKDIIDDDGNEVWEVEIIDETRTNNHYSQRCEFILLPLQYGDLYDKENDWYPATHVVKEFDNKSPKGRLAPVLP